MLEEWGQAIQDAISERDRLRRDLDGARRLLVKTLNEKELTEKQLRSMQRKLAEEQNEHHSTLAVNSDLRRDLDATQTLYREATEAIFNLRTRIRFLEDIAHKTGHIIKLDSGGTL